MYFFHCLLGMELSFTYFHILSDIIIYLFILSEAISCWQCGVFHRGIRDECWKADLQKHNCTACLKTYTRVYLHDSWRTFRCKSVIGNKGGKHNIQR